jgi:hypothetical protein
LKISTVPALTIRQPWAALLVEGSKWFEYRPHRFAAPRIVAIHAGKGQTAQTRKALELSKVRRRVEVSALPYGAVIAVGRLSSCDEGAFQVGGWSWRIARQTRGRSHSTKRRFCLGVLTTPWMRTSTHF